MAFGNLITFVMLIIGVASVVVAFLKGNIKHHLIFLVILGIVGLVVIWLKGYLGQRFTPEEIGLQYAVAIGLIDQVYWTFVVPILSMGYAVFKLKAQYLKLEE